MTCYVCYTWYVYITDVGNDFTHVSILLVTA